MCYAILTQWTVAFFYVFMYILQHRSHDLRSSGRFFNLNKKSAYLQSSKMTKCLMKAFNVCFKKVYFLVIGILIVVFSMYLEACIFQVKLYLKIFDDTLITLWYIFIEHQIMGKAKPKVFPKNLSRLHGLVHGSSHIDLKKEPQSLVSLISQISLTDAFPLLVL